MYRRLDGPQGVWKVAEIRTTELMIILWVVMLVSGQLNIFLWKQVKLHAAPQNIPEGSHNCPAIPRQSNFTAF
jgi:hypothetical protein